MPLKAARY